MTNHRKWLEYGAIQHAPYISAAIVQSGVPSVVACYFPKSFRLLVEDIGNIGFRQVKRLLARIRWSNNNIQLVLLQMRQRGREMERTMITKQTPANMPVIFPRAVLV